MSTTRKPIAIFALNEPKNRDFVFTPEQIAKIESLVDLRHGGEPLTAADILNGAARDAEFIFSTWSMPALTSAQAADFLPNLRAVFYAAGDTSFFAPQLLEEKVRVFSAWRANAIPVAEFCLGQILLSLKGYFRNELEYKKVRGSCHPASGPGAFGESIALIGNGAVASKLRDFLRPHDLRVTMIPTRDAVKPGALKEIFGNSAVVSNHLPDLDSNAGVIGAELLRSMRQGATFINTGRGRQVDERALAEVMREREDLTALLDVTFPEPPTRESPLWDLPNVRISSHIAGSLAGEVHRMAEYMIEELQRVLANIPAEHEVFPEIFR